MESQLAQGPPTPVTSGPASRTLASPARRIAAFALDYLVVALYMGALWLATLALGSTLPLGDLTVDPIAGQLIGFVALTLPVILYFAAWEASARQATPGKRVMGLRVVRVNGGRLPWSRSLLRSSVKFAPWELAHTCLWQIPGWPGEVTTIPRGVMAGFGLVWLLVILYLAMPWVSDLRQAPYDRVAGSLVVGAEESGPCE